MDLITLSEYKSLKAVQGTNLDGRLTPLISSVSSLIKSYIGKTLVDFVETDKTDVIYETWQRKALEVQEKPIISISSITIDDETVESEVRPQLDDIVRSDGDNWPSGTRITVVYRGGYFTTNDEGEKEAKVPADLLLAVADLVKYYFDEEWKEARSFQGVSQEAVATSTIRNDPGFPDHIRRVLDLYRGNDYPLNNG